MTMPKTTRAARFHAPGAPDALRLEDAPLPALQPHEICVAVEAAGVNYPDLLQRSGKLPVQTLPHTLGFEAAGRVVAVGAAVRDLAEGARVAVELPRGGGYAQHAIADSARAFVLDGDGSANALVGHGPASGPSSESVVGRGSTGGSSSSDAVVGRGSAGGSSSSDAVVGRGSAGGSSSSDAVVGRGPAGGSSSSDAVVGRGPADGLSASAAVALLTAGRTALLLLRHAGLARGETVFISAAVGGVGSFAVRLAKQLGARVMAGVSSEARVAQAEALGADAVVVYGLPGQEDSEGWAEDVREFTDGKGAEVVLQSTGGSMTADSLLALAERGRLIQYGADNVITPDGLTPQQVRALVAQSQTFGGFGLMRVPEATRREAFYELEQLARTQVLKLSLQPFALADAAAAHRQLEERRVEGKVILVP